MRPTTDRVREALFASLGSLGAVEGVRVLDLFAGSGALGIEALSRGAAHATFVDQAAPSLDSIRRNLRSLDLDGRAEVVRGEARAYLARTTGLFGLVLLDPPYAWHEWAPLLESVYARLEPSGIVMVESDRELAVGDNWELLRRRRYSATWITLLRSAEPVG